MGVVLAVSLWEVRMYFISEEYLQNMLYTKNLSWTARIILNGHACFNSMEEFLTQINTNRQKAQKYSQPKMNERPSNVECHV